MSWKFHIVKSGERVRCDESSLYSRINYVHNSPDGESSWGGVSGNNKRCTQGLARTRIALCQRLGADTEETRRYDLAWKDLCSVLNALSK